MAPCSSVNSSFLAEAKNHRVWALFIIYGARFGIELTINNVAALYYHDRFGLSIGVVGLIACLFGMMNSFARTLGGVFGDKAGIKIGLRGRVRFTGCVLLLEGLALVLQRQFREGCGVMPAWRRGAWHGSVWPVRYCPAYPQATAATRLARTVPGAAFPAPPGRPAAS